jgi:uncharacterized membrane protein required for colicin V production
MPPAALDGIVLLLALGMGYALASEGLWGAALMTLNILFAGLIALNFYEPLAVIIAENLGFLSGFADTLSLLGIFAVALIALRIGTEMLAPAMVRFPGPVYFLGRWLFGLAGGAMVIGFLLLAFHTAPVHKQIFGVIDYKHAPPFKMGFDHHWLAFFQYTTGQVFASYGSGSRDPFGEYRDSKVFDPRAEWLLQHQEARPYGEGAVLAEDGEAPAGADPAGAPPGGMPPGGMPPGGP